MAKLKFEITLRNVEKFTHTFEEVYDIFYDDGYGISEQEIMKILNNEHPMYDVKIIIESENN